MKLYYRVYNLSILNVSPEILLREHDKIQYQKREQTRSFDQSDQAFQSIVGWLLLAENNISQCAICKTKYL